MPRSALPACLAPVALPDGKVLYGAYTGYNGGRGHTPLFAGDGSSRRSYDFGWDTTEGGAEKQRYFLDSALVAAYTPLAIDARGRLYTQNAGHLYVVGGP